MKHLSVFRIFHRINGTYNPPYTIKSIANVNDSRIGFIVKKLFKIYEIDVGITIPVVALSNDDLHVNDAVKWIQLDDNIWLVKKIV